MGYLDELAALNGLQVAARPFAPYRIGRFPYSSGYKIDGTWPCGRNAVCFETPASRPVAIAIMDAAYGEIARLDDLAAFLGLERSSQPVTHGAGGLVVFARPGTGAIRWPAAEALLAA